MGFITKAQVDFSTAYTFQQLALTGKLQAVVFRCVDAVQCFRAYQGLFFFGSGEQIAYIGLFYQIQADTVTP